MTQLWDNVVGQAKAVAQLEGALENPVHAYLFIGPAGSGKRQAARALAAALLCPHGGDGTCRSCRLALSGTHPDLREVERTGASISVEQAREIIRLASLAPVEGSRKVMVLDEFHLVQPPAAAALLKTIEEPPASTVLVVIADDIPVELVTIASRCVRIEFGAVPAEVIVEALMADGAEPEAARAAADAAAGNLDRARVLVRDPEVGLRRDAFHRLPERLDGTGAVVAQAVDELLGLIEAAAQPLQSQQAEELAALQAQLDLMGDRGGARRRLDDRHKRELRRHRTDELKAGLATLAAAYRDRLAAGHRDAGLIHDGIAALHDAAESMERNPNESLLLQALLLRLPPV